MKRIFILEDDKIHISLYKNILKMYDLTIADNFVKAIEIIEYQPLFDVYIIDVQIKGSRFKGLDLLEFINKSKTIIISAHDLRFQVDQWDKLKDMKYLRKPYKQTELLSTIKNIIEWQA
jgi:DNA-binding NtrC family response regulator